MGTVFLPQDRAILLRGPGATANPEDVDAEPGSSCLGWQRWRCKRQSRQRNCQESYSQNMTSYGYQPLPQAGEWNQVDVTSGAEERWPARCSTRMDGSSMSGAARLGSSMPWVFRPLAAPSLWQRTPPPNVPILPGYGVIKLGVDCRR